METKVLHVFKSVYTLPKQHFLGSTKDIRGRTEYFHDRNISYDELLVDGKDNYRRHIAGYMKDKLHEYSAVILEMTFSPDAASFIRRHAPNTKVLVRSHNAELLHRWDWIRAAKLWQYSAGMLARPIRNFLFDYLCGRRADYVLSIDRWETNHYWRRFADESKLKYVPFFLPEQYLSDLPRRTSKKLRCVNFTSSIPNPLIIDATKNFIGVVRNLNGRGKEWSFCITGDQSKFHVNSCQRIHWTGYLESPYEVLAESRAMALLSDYGYGFKTKILEAIMAKAYILMTEGLYKRIPDEVRPYCKPVDIRSVDSFENALEQCKKPYPEGNPNKQFRDQAFAALDEVLLG